MSAARDGGAEDPLPPVFIYGALRSGTTLLRLILDSHPDIDNPGEADFLFDHIAPDATHASGWRYDREGLAADRIFRTKAIGLPQHLDGRDLLLSLCGQLRRDGVPVLTLNVHRHARKVLALLPRARLVHLVRDPRDVSHSVIQMGWAGTVYHGADLWAETEAEWDLVAPHLGPGQAFDLRYEDLCRDPERVLGDLCRYLGVAYDPRMLSFHERSSYSAISPHLAQRWRHDARRRDIAELESRIGPLMVARGYPLSGDPARPGPVSRLRLELRNRLGMWRFGTARYGVLTFWGEKITRRCGLGALNRRFARRKDRISLDHLK